MEWVSREENYSAIEEQDENAFRPRKGLVSPEALWFVLSAQLTSPNEIPLRHPLRGASFSLPEEHSAAQPGPAYLLCREDKRPVDDRAGWLQTGTPVGQRGPNEVHGILRLHRP